MSVYVDACGLCMHVGVWTLLCVCMCERERAHAVYICVGA